MEPNNIVINMDERKIKEYILNYLDEKADEIKPFDPYSYYRLNEIRSELKHIFKKI